jgi:hypothetical protein
VLAVGLLLATGGWLWRERLRQGQLALELMSQAEIDVQQRRWPQAVERSQALLASSELPASLRQRAASIEHIARSEQAEQLRFEQYQAQLNRPELEDATLLAYRQIGAGSVYFSEAAALFREHAGRRSRQYVDHAEQARQRGQCAESQGLLMRATLLQPESPQLREVAARPCVPAATQPEPGSAEAVPAGPVLPASADGAASPEARPRAAAKKNAAPLAAAADSELDFVAASTLLQEVRQATSPKQGLLLAIKATHATKQDFIEEAWEYVFRFACQLREKKWLKSALPQLPNRRRAELLHETDCLDQTGEPRTYTLRAELR